MHKASSWALLAGAVCVAGLVLFVDYIPLDLGPISYYRERISYAMHPSAPRAYEYGLRHFSAADARAYDLEYASYFFRQSIAQDATYGHPHHQLGRIAFLNGDFATARQEINEELELHPDNPHAYYVRGLIQGYQGAYSGAARDFAHFIEMRPEVWAGYNDRAWVLMKLGRYQDAVETLTRGLSKYPDNAWLLNSYAIAIYEVGDAVAAEEAAHRAVAAVSKLTPEDWSNADPGNDPAIAPVGLQTFQDAARANLNKILMHDATSTIELPDNF